MLYDCMTCDGRWIITMENKNHNTIYIFNSFAILSIEIISAVKFQNSKNAFEYYQKDHQTMCRRQES